MLWKRVAVLSRAGDSGPVFGIAALRREQSVRAIGAPTDASTPAKAGQKRRADANGCATWATWAHAAIEMIPNGRPCGEFCVCLPELPSQEVPEDASQVQQPTSCWLFHATLFLQRRWCVLLLDLYQTHVHAAATTRNQAASARERPHQTPRLARRRWPRVSHRAQGPQARSRALHRALAALRMPRRPPAAPQPQKPWAALAAQNLAAAASRRSTRSRCTARSAHGWPPRPAPGPAPARTRASAGAGASMCSCRRPARRRARRAAQVAPPRSAAWTRPRSCALCCASSASKSPPRAWRNGGVRTPPRSSARCCGSSASKTL